MRSSLVGVWLLAFAAWHAPWSPVSAAETPGDLVIVAFSGHGVQLEGKSYLCPLDAEIEKVPTTSIRLDGVYDRLAKSQASLKLLLVDACRNDVVPVGRRSVAVSRSLGEFAGVKEAPPEGILLLASCGPGQVRLRREVQVGVSQRQLSQQPGLRPGLPRGPSSGGVDK